MAIILKNATFIDWKTLDFRQTHIKVQPGIDGIPELFNDNGDLKGEKDDEIHDCTDKLVTKSFANGHHHIYSALARGMPTPPRKPSNFHEKLKYVWWRLDSALSKEMIGASALVTAMECAKNGVTFVIDHHSSPSAIEGSLEIIADAFDSVGIGHLLCYEITDRNGTEAIENGFSEMGNYLRKGQGLVGLHASFTVSDQTLIRAVQLAEKLNSGIHMHAAEDPVDQKNSMSLYNKRVIERLNQAGVVQFPKTILAHCLHINDNERKLLADSPAWVVQNTESNLNNRVGYFNSTGLGENIMLGTDGMHSNMLSSTRAAFLNGNQDPHMNPDLAYHRLRNVHRYLSGNAFKGDGENNLVVFDYPSPTSVNQDNFTAHFVYGIETKHIRHVISNGKLIVQGGQMKTVDEKDILKYSQEMAGILWKKLS